MRIAEFKSLGKNGSEDKLFSELCFCILTANFQAEKSMKIQSGIGVGFLTLSEMDLAIQLRLSGHRFPNTRAKYIVEARKHAGGLRKILGEYSSSETGLRDRIVKDVKGLGYKEASHFMRNIGYENVAIIDFHIIDILADNKLIERPKSKSLTRKKYLEIEIILEKIAENARLTLAELDLYLWYLETRTVLK